MSVHNPSRAQSNSAPLFANSLSSTAEGVLDAAQALIQQNGYNGFSYEDVSRIVGLKKPSIHHYFPRKEDLATSVVQRYTERFEGLLADIEHKECDKVQRLNAYLHLFYDTYGAARALCPCGILGAEADSLPPTVTVAVNRFFRINLEWLTTVLAEARSERQLSYQGSASDMAMVLLSALEGAMVVGRGLQDQKVVRQVGATILHNLVGADA